MLEPGCNIMLENLPETVIMYSITNEGCEVFMGMTGIEEIMEYLEANPDK
jgi:hypothetical protein